MTGLKLVGEIQLFEVGIPEGGLSFRQNRLRLNPHLAACLTAALVVPLHEFAERVHKFGQALCLQAVDSMHRAFLRN